MRHPATRWAPLSRAVVDVTGDAIFTVSPLTEIATAHLLSNRVT